MATILCVDDETQLRQLIVMELEDAGYDIVEAGNGQEAIDRALEQRPDLILSDVTMPVLDGYGMLETLWSEHPEYADVPFVLLSALVDRKRTINGVELQDDSYLTKPVDIDLLLERVGTKISNAGSRAP